MALSTTHENGAQRLYVGCESGAGISGPGEAGTLAGRPTPGGSKGGRPGAASAGAGGAGLEAQTGDPATGSTGR